MLKRLWVIGVLVVVSLCLGAAQGAPQGFGNYIVVLKDGGASPAQVATEHGRAFGFKGKLVYSHALRGYAAALPEAALAGIASRPEVRFVSNDGEVRAAQTLPPQAVSFGVLRIDGDESSTRSGNGRGSVSINVAVIDDGGPVPHPDLNVAGATSCLQHEGSDNASTNPMGWHGTMVGGFIGALDNSIGRVGVAAGARLWAVRSLDSQGHGLQSEIICGLDWVTGTRADADPGNDIAVANMSLGGLVGPSEGACGGGEGSDAWHTAICRTVAAGVTVVAAAGNESKDLRRIAPATYDVVLAVTAMSDGDGQPGGLAGQLNCLPSETDDTAATFSNFARLAEDLAHTVAAPGSCIGSTYPGGQYSVGSGTSYASPLVAGTVALCIASGPCAGLTPLQIIQKVVGDAAAYNAAKKNAGYGFQGDPLRSVSGKYFGYLIRAAQY